MNDENYSQLWRWMLFGCGVVAVIGGARGCGQRTGAFVSAAQLGELPFAAPVSPIPTALPPTPTIEVPASTPAVKSERRATPVSRPTRVAPETVAPTATPTVAVPPTESAEALRTYLRFDAGIAFGFASVTPRIDNSCCSVGPSVGIGVEKEINRTFSLWPSIRYVAKGGRAVLGGSQVEVNLDYLELPLLVKARWQEGRIRPFVFAGPNLAINVGAQGVAYGVTRNLKSGIAPIDVSVDAGVGIDYVLDERWSLSLANRFSLGLTDADRSADVWRSRSFQVQGGVRVSLP